MSRPERGQYGNTRGKPNIQVRRRKNREADPRWQAAQAETAKHQRELDELIEMQKQQPAVGPVEGAAYARAQAEREEALAASQAAQRLLDEAHDEADTVAEETEPVQVAAPKKKRFSTKRLRQEGEAKYPLAFTNAVMMLKAGYHIEYVIEFTGIGYLELDHIEIDSEGYGVVHKEEDHEDE